MINNITGARYQSYIKRKRKEKKSMRSSAGQNAASTLQRTNVSLGFAFKKSPFFRPKY